MTARFLPPALLSLLLMFGCTKKETETPAPAPASSDQPAPAAKVDPDRSSKGEVLILNDGNFQDTIAEGLVLVDFWATWCGPCQYQGPIVEKLASQVKGIATVAKLDVDKAPITANQYRIESIPTLALFKDGALIKQFVGVTKGNTLLAAINDAK